MTNSDSKLTELHPWGIICALLFEHSSDEIVDIVSRAGMLVDWSLTNEQAYSHSTRRRAYRPRVDSAFNSLSEKHRLRVTWVVVTEILRRDRDVLEELRRQLLPIGWEVTETGIRPANREVSELFLPGGTPHDAYVEIRKIIISAQQDITIIDPYMDGTLLPLLASNPSQNLKVNLLTSRAPSDFGQELEKFLSQHDNLTIETRRSREFHDRFIIVDGSKCYHVGASIKDAGNRAFMISQVEDAENIKALITEQSNAWNKAKPL